MKQQEKPASWPYVTTLQANDVWGMRALIVLSIALLGAELYWGMVRDATLTGESSAQAFARFIGVVATPYLVALGLSFVRRLKEAAYAVLLLICAPALTLCLGLLLLGGGVNPEGNYIFFSVLALVSHLFLFEKTITGWRAAHWSRSLLGVLLISGIAAVGVYFFVWLPAL